MADDKPKNILNEKKSSPDQAAMNDRSSSRGSRVDSRTGKLGRESGTGNTSGWDNRSTPKNERQSDSISRTGYKNIKNSTEKMQDLGELSEARDLSS